MIRNYFKIAIRNLWKDRTFTALNIIGLSVAFGVAFLLSTYALYELSYNQFHKNKGSIFQLYTVAQTPKGQEANNSYPIPFAPALKDEVLGVEKISRYEARGALISYGNKTFNLIAAWADPDFLDIFSFPVIAGDNTYTIDNRSSIALTQKTAKKLFGKENPLGKTLTIQREGSEEPVTVTAILKDIPSASSLNFEVLLNFKVLPDSYYADNLDRWDANNHDVYLQLAIGITPKQFEKSTQAFSNLHFADEIATVKRDGAQPNAAGNYQQIKLLPFEDVSFATIDEDVVKVSKTLQFLVLGIAFLILFIASVNFINMSIAKGSQRLREIGMRKTLGAGKAQLFFQFWGESVLVFTISVSLGLLIAYLLLPSFQTLFRTEASFALISNPKIIMGLLLSILIITLVAGGYPALLMSKLGTLQALKGKLEVTGRNRVRDGLMVLQFSIAILLISGTLVLWGQLDYMRTKDLGFNKEQVLSFPLSTKKDHRQVMRLMRDELADKPGILSVTASNNTLGLGKDHSSATIVLGFDYKDREVKTNMLMVDYDYIKTLDIKLLKGRTFNRNYGSDSLSIVINESMAKELNEKDPLNVQFFLDDSIKYSVIGVVKDYNFQGLDKAIEPISFFLDPQAQLRYAYVKVAPGNLPQSYDRVKKAWNTIAPDTEFQGSFLDENIDRTLRKERAMTTMISSGSILAIILSCIGLFAISLLVVSQRQKEIGIRKVVWASVSTITVLLAKDFLKLVGIAFLIATPIAWYVTSQWLQNYVYRINLTIWTFLAAGGIAVFIALFTISIRTIRAASANPIKSLRTE